MEVILRITNGGAFGLGFPANLTWIAGAAPSLKAVGDDLIIFWTHDGGTTWLAEAVGQGSSGGVNYFLDGSGSGAARPTALVTAGTPLPYTVTKSGIAVLKVGSQQRILGGGDNSTKTAEAVAIVAVSPGDVISWSGDSSVANVDNRFTRIMVNGVEQATARAYAWGSNAGVEIENNQMDRPKPAGNLYLPSYNDAVAEYSVTAAVNTKVLSYSFEILTP
jgi:hypothetical protein